MRSWPISLKISVNTRVYFFTTYSLSVLKPYFFSLTQTVTLCEGFVGFYLAMHVL